MSKIFYEKLKIKGSLVNGENPYPNLKINKVHFKDNEETKKELNLNYGNVKTVLPYTMQDNYLRTEEEIELDTIVLENSKLRATFLKGYGARLWSLFDKESECELLHRNEVFYPSNLAIRNAWFAGGVEWNIGFRGHSPFTYDNVFVEELYDDELDIPVLKFYEWERTRKAAYFVYAYLPKDSDRLIIRVNIKNYSGEDVPMYWWSNIAVKETTGTRVIVPSKYAWTYGYGGGICKAPVPYWDRKDITYSVQQQYSRDYFFHIDDDKRKYVAAIDENGMGLLQLSTARLKSRKLFLWGMCRSYRNWQDFLSKPATPYIEIQGGIAQTQMECIKMPKDASWDWIEAYGKIKVNPDKAHSQSWDDAVICTEEFAAKYDSIVSEAELKRARKYDDISGKTVATGAGWAKVENEYRKKDGIAIMPEFENVQLKPEEKMWVDLINGEFPNPIDDSNVLASFSLDTKYLKLLEEYTEKVKNNWFAYYTLAVGYAGLELDDKALDCALKSLEIYECKYNLRLIACLYDNAENDKAVYYIKKAYEKSERDFYITRDTFEILSKFKRYEDMISYYKELCGEMSERGRMKLYALYAYVSLKNIKECEKLLSEKFVVDDLKEGEKSLTDIWYDFCYLKMERDNIQTDNKKEYVDRNYEMPIWMDYKYIK